MYVLDMVGTIILFIKEMYGNKNKKFSWSGAFSVVGCGANQLFIFIWPNISINQLAEILFNKLFVLSFIFARPI